MNYNEQQASGPIPHLIDLEDSFDVLARQARVLGNIAKMEAKRQSMAGTQCEATIEDIYKNIEDIHARLDVLAADIARLSTRQHASDHNDMAFTLNTMCRFRAWTITALHHYVTNQPIPGFTVTAQELLDLNTADLDGIMVALGLAIDSPHDDKIKRSKAKIGLIPA